MRAASQSIVSILAETARAAGRGLAVLSLVLAPVASPALAQVRNVDPNASIDSDLAPLPQNTPAQSGQYDQAGQGNVAVDSDIYSATGDDSVSSAGTQSPATPAASGVYQRDDLIASAEGVFGKGAEGLAGIIEKILNDQGEPNAYIAGREASGAIVVGLRYGSGTLSHKIEGQRDIYWTGPSIGFDLGGNAAKTFVLVYNLHDTQDIYRRYPAGEGAAYLVGGFTASYLRRGNIVIIPIRLGVGYRLGANIGYMKFSEKQRWLPF